MSYSTLENGIWEIFWSSKSDNESRKGQLLTIHTANSKKYSIKYADIKHRREDVLGIIQKKFNATNDDLFHINYCMNKFIIDVESTYYYR